MQRSRGNDWTLWIGAACLCLAACGDDGRESASDGATATLSGSTGATTSATAPTTSGASEGGSTDGGTASDSATVTGEPEPTTGGTGSSTTGAATDTGSGSQTCDEAPPKGFMGPFDASCKTEPKVGTFNPVIEWHKDTWTSVPDGPAGASAPIVVQLSDDDGDGMITDSDVPDIAFISYGAGGGVLRAISGDGSKELFSVGGVGLTREKCVAAADIDGDGIVEIITSNNARQILAFEHDGAAKWTSQAVTAHVGIYEVAPAISDMNGDGVPEIVVGRAVLDNQGNLIGAGSHGIGAAEHQNGSASMSFAVDVDGDGEQEVVVGNALYNLAGGAVWFNGQTDGYPAVGDFDLDGAPEIVVVPTGRVRLQSSEDGAVLWDVAVPGGLGGPPTVADFDGDGLPEIGVAGKSRYSVFEGDGAVLWTNVTQDASSGITGSAVYDFEGDGIAEVVYADETNLWIYAGNDGAVKLQLSDHNSGTRLEYPVIADVDGDGQVEVAFVSEPYSGTYTGLTVIGDADLSWRPGRKIWNQHAYHITNVADDGAIPAQADQNWKLYNNFRSGDLSAPDGLVAPDLKMIAPESCVNECGGEDIVNVWVQLGNTGAAPLLAGAVIDVYGTTMGVESLLTSVDVPTQLQPGEFADAIVIPVMTTDLEQIRLVAAPKEAECVVDMANELVLVPPFCSIPG